MTAEEIFKTMQDLIAEQFAIDAEEITMDSSFVDDLGADSLASVELAMALEEATGVSIDTTPITPHVLYRAFKEAGLIHDEKEGD